ncbi:MAG: hypothetical protein PHC90_09650 [Syntrophorhabdaceae bacterium]|nr:hypothetical protein [Syntrophorhabdaceae bacterium]
MIKRGLLVFVAAVFFLSAMQSLSAAAESRKKAVTPSPGSVDRKVIIDALREEMQKLHGISAVFVVKRLKVLDGWAWIETFPRSPDGTSQYEGVSALLRKSGIKWKVAEIACSEEDNEECVGSTGYFRLLKKRFPGVPTEILPE